MDDTPVFQNNTWLRVFKKKTGERCYSNESKRQYETHVAETTDDDDDDDDDVIATRLGQSAACALPGQLDMGIFSSEKSIDRLYTEQKGKLKLFDFIYIGLLSTLREASLSCQGLASSNREIPGT